MKRPICLVLLSALLCTSPFFAPAPLFAQATDPTEDAGPEPYEADEFEQWMHDLRRGEIVAIGAFPLVLAFTSFLYGPIRFVAKSIESGFVNPLYAPWFFAPPEAPPFDSDESGGLLLTALILSIGIGVLDHILGLEETPPGE